MLINYEMLVRERGLPLELLQQTAHLRTLCEFQNATSAATVGSFLVPSETDHGRRRAVQQLIEFNVNRSESDAWRDAPTPILRELVKFDTCTCQAPRTREPPIRPNTTRAVPAKTTSVLS